MYKSLIVLGLLGGVVGGPCLGADLVMENARLRAVLGADASWRALVDKTTGKDYCAAGKRIPMATVHVGAKSHSACRAALAGGRLTLGFSGCDTECVYQVTTTADWIAFQLERISGARPSHLTLFSVGVTLTDRMGPILNAAWNDQYAICLRGINLQTSGRAARHRDIVQLSATSQDEPGPKLEGAGVALLGARPDELRVLLGRLASKDLRRRRTQMLSRLRHNSWPLGRFGT